MAESTVPTPAPGAFAPLRQPVFAVLWAATVLGNIGSFMRDVASSWLVTDLSASPTAVALIQTAAPCRSSCSRSRPACCRTSSIAGAS